MMKEKLILQLGVKDWRLNIDAWSFQILLYPMHSQRFTKFLVIFLLPIVCSSCRLSSKEKSYIKLNGAVFGTYYHITYLHPKGEDLHTDIKEKLHAFDLSLSTFNPQSIISKINRNEDVVVDEFFEQMYRAAVQVSRNTHGAFDISVAPLINAWGFGFGNKARKESPDIASILPYVGYEKISLIENRIIKADKRMMLDASAIAKGQAADVIGQLLSDKGCTNYMVEIGGEIVCKGVNPSGELWRIGIDSPEDALFEQSRELHTVLALTDCGMATSGNYRQYYYRDGKKYAHTIDPITGYPVNHNLLSATVVASSSMLADAYATAFMVLGVDSSLAICNRLAEIECYLISEDEVGKFSIFQSQNFKQYLAAE